MGLRRHLARTPASNSPSKGAFDGDSLVFTDKGTLPHPNATPHDYAALVAADRAPSGGEAAESDGDYHGPAVAQHESAPAG